MKNIYFLLVFFMMLSSCKSSKSATEQTSSSKTPFVWENATVYFLLTDRFNNGDTTNDKSYNRTNPTATLRGFEGGDIRGVIQKLDEGYFDKLGVNALWLTPLVEQIHGGVDEGTGFTYGFHGYWAKDWTALDANFGTRADLKELVDKAHAKGIRIMLDAVINHTGHATKLDKKYPEDWVRSSPNCTYNSYENYINCTLVSGLFDVKTESNQPVELPPMLIEKWKKEGRYEQEIKELDAFFAKYHYPRAPKYYIMKWLADYILDFGIDGYRVDTVKHTYEDVWADFSNVCKTTFDEYKSLNPTKVLDNNPFYLVGEVYGYGIQGKQIYDFGDKKVNYFENGFDALINFSFKGDANHSYESVFSSYADIINKDLNGKTVMNYVSSHDDSYPFDKNREKTYESATKLLLAPGITQIYYGDESARSLNIPNTQGDATLRSFMNWNDIKNNTATQELLLHWQKLGQFRKKHVAVGAGLHKSFPTNNYVFGRIYSKNNINDKVLIGLNLNKGLKQISAENLFAEGETVHDFYSGKTATVTNGTISIDSPYTLLLIEKK